MAITNVLGPLAMQMHRSPIKSYIGSTVRTVRWAWKDSLRRVCILNAFVMNFKQFFVNAL